LAVRMGEVCQTVHAPGRNCEPPGDR